ncbi:unnamed protein product [Orchesella dallaii]|uniref:Uncharacterized protein n=1 Tax=Orchesella dallaii TaxID=48710 RepID=A0ABP1RUP1_9HEXA
MAGLVQEHNHATGETGDQVPAAPSIFGVASDSGVSTDTVNTTRLSTAPRVRTSPATARYAISTSNGYDLQRDSPMNTSYILKAAEDTWIEAKKTGIVETGLTVYLSEGMFMHIEDHRRPIDKFQSFKVLGGFLENAESGKLRIVLENTQPHCGFPIKRGDSIAHLAFSELSFVEPLLMETKDFNSYLERMNVFRHGSSSLQAIPRYGPSVLLPVYDASNPAVESELFNLDTARSVMSDQTDEIPTAIPDSKIEEMNAATSIIPDKDLDTSSFLTVNEDELSSFLNGSVNETDNNGLQANNQESLDTQRELPSSSSAKHTGEYELVSDDDSTTTDLANTDLVDYWKKHKYIEDDGSGYDSSTDTEDREDSTPASKRIKLA